MDRGAWRTTVYGVAESDMIEQLGTAQYSVILTLPLFFLIPALSHLLVHKRRLRSSSLTAGAGLFKTTEGGEREASSPLSSELGATSIWGLGLQLLHSTVALVAF